MKKNIAKSLNEDAALAVKEIREQFADIIKDIRCITFFVSYKYDSNAMAAAIAKHFPDIECFGATSNKEIATNGVISSNSLVAFAFTSDLVEDFCIEVVEHLSSDIDVDVMEIVVNFERHYNNKLHDLSRTEYFGLAFMDFNSKAEEKLFDQLGDFTNVVFFGGTASDEWLFQNTGIYAQGKYYKNAAVICLFKSKVKFGFEKIETITKTSEPLIVTKSDVGSKILYEIDGRPAAEVYCEVNGLDYEKLSEINGAHHYIDFQKHPVGLVIEGETFLRVVHGINKAEKSLIMVCNIHEGLPVHFYKTDNIVERTRTQIENIQKKYNNISCMLTLVCSNVHEDFKRESSMEEYASLYDGIACAGFCTYGEYYTVPVNHTTTILVFEKE